jgi:hypothetical protein
VIQLTEPSSAVCVVAVAGGRGTVAMASVSPGSPLKYWECVHDWPPGTSKSNLCKVVGIVRESLPTKEDGQDDMKRFCSVSRSRPSSKTIHASRVKEACIVDGHAARAEKIGRRRRVRTYHYQQHMGLHSSRGEK